MPLSPSISSLNAEHHSDTNMHADSHPPTRAIPIPADLSKFAEVERLVAEVRKTTDHLDILVANAGATWGEALDTHPDEAVGKVLDLNVRSVFAVVRLYVSLILLSVSFFLLFCCILPGLFPFLSIRENDPKKWFWLSSLFGNFRRKKICAIARRKSYA